MKNNLLCLILILFSFIGFAQTNVSLNKFYNNLPIDSCLTYIKTKMVDTNLYEAIDSKDQEYKINLSFDNQNIDSVIMRFACMGLAVGGSRNQVSPIVYEQWLTNTYYFISDSAANTFFKNQKVQLDSFDKEPYLNENNEEITWTYSLEVIDIKCIRNRQVHLTYEKNSKRVKSCYRLIFDNNPCNCD